MLQFSLVPEEYFTINGDIVVQLSDVSGGRAWLRIEADRSIPILRGKVLEREGLPRPACLNSKLPKRKQRRQDPIYLWSRDRERAARTMEALLTRLEQEGDPAAAELLRAQLQRLLPTVWEEEVSGVVREALKRRTAGP